MAVTNLRNLATILLFLAFQVVAADDRVDEARIIIQVHERVTITSTTAQVERVVLYNTPFRELVIPPDAPEAYWRDWLIPTDAAGVSLSTASAEAMGITVRYHYPLTSTRTNFATTITLPTLSLPPADPHLIVNYPLALELDHYIEINVPGFAIAPPAPEYRRWGSDSYLLVTPILKPADRATASETEISPTNSLHVERHYHIAQGASAVWEAMSHAAPLTITYQAFRPGYAGLEGYLGTMAIAGIIALALLILITQHRYALTTFGYNRVNNIFALLVLASGLSLLGISAYLWRDEGQLELYRALRNVPFGAYVPSVLAAPRVERLPLIGGFVGGYLTYWSLAAFGRAAWTRWSGIAISVIGALYVVSLNVLLLPFPEFFTGQRLALTVLAVVVMLGASVVAGAFFVADKH